MKRRRRKGGNPSREFIDFQRIVSESPRLKEDDKFLKHVLRH